MHFYYGVNFTFFIFIPGKESEKENTNYGENNYTNFFLNYSKNSRDEKTE